MAKIEGSYMPGYDDPYAVDIALTAAQMDEVRETVYALRRRGLFVFMNQQNDGSYLVNSGCQDGGDFREVIRAVAAKVEIETDDQRLIDWMAKA